MMHTRQADSSVISYNPVPFNFVDLEEKASNYIAKVNDEAKRIREETKIVAARIREEAVAEWKHSAEELAQAKTQAREEADAIRKQLDGLHLRLKAEEENFQTRKDQLESEAVKLKAQIKQNEDAARKTGYDEGKQVGYDEGHAQGYADGETKAMVDYTEKVHREAEIQLGIKLETLLPALTTMIERMELAKQSFLQHWEHVAVKIAEAIAAKAIDRQLPEMVDVPMRLLREALELGACSTSVRVRLNQQDYEALRPQMDAIIKEMTRSVETEVVGDPSVSPGGCILETPQGVIDNRLETRLARIVEELCPVENEVALS